MKMMEDEKMSNVKKSATELIGKTPLLEVSNFSSAEGADGATILAKLEYLNPAGSVKDRIALAMIEDGEKKGILKKGATIIEPTSGNTGIGLAAVAAARLWRGKCIRIDGILSAVCSLHCDDCHNSQRIKELETDGWNLVLPDIGCVGNERDSIPYWVMFLNVSTLDQMQRGCHKIAASP